MIYEQNHVGVRISDLDASIAFYTEVLGAQVVDRAYIPSSSTDCVHLQIAGGLVELLRPANPPSGIRFGLDHIGFMSDDLDGDHQRLGGAGFTFSVPPKVAGTGRGRLAFLSDPNGVRVELLQRDEIFRIPRITAGFVRDLDHISIRADQLAAAEHFYRERLAMTPVATRTGSAGATMSYLRIGDDAIELLHQDEPRQDADLIGHLGLRVDDVDQTTEYLRSKGVEIEAGFPRPAGDGDGRLTAVGDPDGVPIQFCDRAELGSR